MTWSSRSQILCTFHWDVRFLLYNRVDPLLAHIARANAQTFEPIPKAERGKVSAQMCWHRPVFAAEDVPHPMVFDDVVPNSITIDLSMSRRCYPRRGLELVRQHDRIVVVNAQNFTMGYLAGIAKTQAIADAWVLEGKTRDLTNKQVIPQ